MIFACGSAASPSDGQQRARRRRCRGRFQERCGDSWSVLLRVRRPRRVLLALLAGKPDDRLRIGLGRASPRPGAPAWRRAAAWRRRLARRRPAIARRSVLHHARVGAEDVAVQILRAGVAEVLAVLERRVVDLDQRVLVARVVLRPARRSSTRSLLPISTTSTPCVAAISSALATPSSVSIITVTSMLSLTVAR